MNTRSVRFSNYCLSETVEIAGAGATCQCGWHLGRTSKPVLHDSSARQPYIPPTPIPATSPSLTHPCPIPSHVHTHTHPPPSRRPSVLPSSSIATPYPCRNCPSRCFPTCTTIARRPTSGRPCCSPIGVSRSFRALTTGPCGPRQVKISLHSGCARSLNEVMGDRRRSVRN